MPIRGFGGGAPAPGAGGLSEYTYIVVRDNGTYTVYDWAGVLAHGPGADADVEINWALTNAGAGGVVALERDTIFPIDDPITFTANQQWLRGGGRGTFIDGDTLATTEHGIVISGFDDCRISNLSIQTQDGGGKVCHCIFIEDGSDRFLIENVVIIDSDDDGLSDRAELNIGTAANDRSPSSFAPIRSNLRSSPMFSTSRPCWSRGGLVRPSAMRSSRAIFHAS